jgi:hypothetical protein
MRWRAGKPDEVIDLAQRLASYTVAPAGAVVLPPDADPPPASVEHPLKITDDTSMRSATVRLPDVPERPPDPQPAARRSGRHRRRSS